MSLVFTLRCITVSNHTHIGEPPAATADLAIDDDCISEISDFFEEEENSENVLYQNLKMV